MSKKNDTERELSRLRAEVNALSLIVQRLFIANSTQNNPATANAIESYRDMFKNNSTITQLPEATRIEAIGALDRFFDPLIENQKMMEAEVAEQDRLTQK